MKTNSNFTFQPLGPELMIYDKLQDKVHILNETATRILNLHRKGHSPKEIETRLKSYFALDEKRNISSDISSALDQIKGLFLTRKT